MLGGIHVPAVNGLRRSKVYFYFIFLFERIHFFARVWNRGPGDRPLLVTMGKQLVCLRAKETRRLPQAFSKVKLVHNTFLYPHHHTHTHTHAQTLVRAWVDAKKAMRDMKMPKAGTPFGPGKSSFVPSPASRKRLEYFPITAKAAIEVKSRPTLPRSSFLQEAVRQMTVERQRTANHGVGWEGYSSETAVESEGAPGVDEATRGHDDPDDGGRVEQIRVLARLLLLLLRGKVSLRCNREGEGDFLLGHAQAHRGVQRAQGPQRRGPAPVSPPVVGARRAPRGPRAGPRDPPDLACCSHQSLRHLVFSNWTRSIH